MSLKPRYWDTNKGEVLKAIVNSQWRTFIEIQELSKLSQYVLRQVLVELINDEKISEAGNDYSPEKSKYWIEDYDLYCEYRDYLAGNYDSKYLTKEYREETKRREANAKFSEMFFDYIEKNQYEKTIIKTIIWESLREGVKFKLLSEHFFVEGDLLDSLCKDVLDFSRKNVIVVNPFVDQCSLSDKLKDISGKGLDVTLLTRSPASEYSSRVRKLRKKYHDVLKKSGVKILYNDRIHSKIILSDGMLGIVSSMNFKSESSSGKNHEAGIITWEKQTIGLLSLNVENLLKDLETNVYD